MIALCGLVRVRVGEIAWQPNHQRDPETYDLRICACLWLCQRTVEQADKWCNRQGKEG